jgi:2-keto-3-deoxy-L-rhamnonate aldolase RhmA
MKKNELKAKLAAGKPVYGTMVQYPDPDIVEMLGYAGFDWILIDAEHGSINENDCLAMVRACELTGTTSIVRPANHHADTILRFLDRGAQGVQVPHVNTAEEARAVVQAVKYHPMGKRGVTSFTRPGHYGFREPVPEYCRSANEETLVCVMIEEMIAVHNLPELLAVDGVDVYFIGVADLAQTMGFPGNKNAPEVQALVGRALESIIAAGKVAGVSCGEEQMAEFASRGVQYFHTGMTPLIKFAARHFWGLVNEERL